MFIEEVRTCSKGQTVLETTLFPLTLSIKQILLHVVVFPILSLKKCCDQCHQATLTKGHYLAFLQLAQICSQLIS